MATFVNSDVDIQNNDHPDKKETKCRCRNRGNGPKVPGPNNLVLIPTHACFCGSCAISDIGYYFVSQLKTDVSLINNQISLRRDIIDNYYRTHLYTDEELTERFKFLGLQGNNIVILESTNAEELRNEIRKSTNSKKIKSEIRNNEPETRIISPNDDQTNNEQINSGQTDKDQTNKDQTNKDQTNNGQTNNISSTLAIECLQKTFGEIPQIKPETDNPEDILSAEKELEEILGLIMEDLEYLVNSEKDIKECPGYDQMIFSISEQNEFLEKYNKLLHDPDNDTNPLGPRPILIDLIKSLPNYPQTNLHLLYFISDNKTELTSTKNAAQLFKKLENSFRELGRALGAAIGLNPKYDYLFGEFHQKVGDYYLDGVKFNVEKYYIKTVDTCKNNLIINQFHSRNLAIYISEFIYNNMFSPSCLEKFLIKFWTMYELITPLTSILRLSTRYGPGHNENVQECLAVLARFIVVCIYISRDLYEDNPFDIDFQIDQPEFDYTSKQIIKKYMKKKVTVAQNENNLCPK